MFEVNPVTELVKLPIPLPSDVWLLAIVAFDEVLQHTPLAVTVSPPLSSTVPPDCAVVVVMLVIDDVVTVGNTGLGIV